MGIVEAIKILKRHSKFIQTSKMVTNKDLGIAIDRVLEEVQKKSIERK